MRMKIQLFTHDLQFLAVSKAPEQLKAGQRICVLLLDEMPPYCDTPQASTSKFARAVFEVKVLHVDGKTAFIGMAIDACETQALQDWLAKHQGEIKPHPELVAIA